VNTASIQPELAASELFGHMRGAFTGAVGSHPGALDRAGDGLLFLDEIADMPMGVQAQLLRALEARVFSPLGSSETRSLDAQVLSATNRPPAAQIETGAFRADLYFRLAQVTINVPPLREREGDLELLVRAFWGRTSPETPFEPALVNAIRGREWRGNVRELRSAVERLCLLRATGDRRPIDAIVDDPEQAQRAGLSQRATLAELREDFERDVLGAVMRRVNGNVSAAARELDVTPRTIYNLLRRHRR
jgi:DNA-binding NtrC family response regulator